MLIGQGVAPTKRCQKVTTEAWKDTKKTNLWVVEYRSEGLVYSGFLGIFRRKFFRSAQQNFSTRMESKSSNGRFSEEQIELSRNEIQINSSLFEIIILDNDYIGNTVNSHLIYSTIKEPILNHSRRANSSTNEDIPNELNTFIGAYPPDDEYATDSDNLESQNENLERLQNESNFSPYFDNTTSALLFCWIQKLNISPKSALTPNPAEDDNNDDIEAQFGFHGYYPYYPRCYPSTTLDPGYSWYGLIPIIHMDAEL
ncbi:hypothetical protein RhiirB3_442758 [Rhizophagus irregularis]|nr:hypothetical protein RhiirB3_442758 [Rhizophagus irregularis]